MIGTTLKELRIQKKYTLEYVAELLGVSRQTISKWENNETLPDILRCKTIADLYDISLDLLVLNESEQHDENRTGKYVFGIVTVGERGQIVIPQKARKVFHINPGDQLLFLGDVHQGMGIMKVDELSDMLEAQKEDL